MVVITCRFAQLSALVFKIDVSWITTQQIVYYPLDVSLGVSISGSKSVSVRWRCTCSIASPACLLIVCGAILARKASIRLIMTKHRQVSFHCRLHLFMPQILNTPLLPFSDFGARYLHQIQCFLYCWAPKPAFGHFSHIQYQGHVRLFQLYTTSLSCHSSRHVEPL